MTTKITTSTTLGEVTVSVATFTELFKPLLPLGLDSYQRPFVWKEDKMAQLINDLDEFIAPSTKFSKQAKYYMGAVLLHDDDERKQRFIIDGQQRITALCVLHHALTKSLPKKCSLEYRSLISKKNILRAQEICLLEKAQSLNHEIFNRITFTVISVNSQDLAFTFFDTQNNRGVPLHATDLLKAYHLREITGKKRLEAQEDCAKSWEDLQRIEPIIGKKEDFAPSLFHHLLWRARRWSGQSVIIRESFDEMIKEFQHNTLPPPAANQFALYPSRSKYFTATQPQGTGYRIIRDAVKPCQLVVELPFTIRQPINKGIGFFLYAEKYAALSHKLLYDAEDNPEIKAFRKFYKAVIADLSIYLRELFLLASVMYYDQFAFDKLFTFVLWLDHVLGSIRIEKQYIFREAPRKFLCENKRNLLDVIAGSFRPEEVINFLREYTEAKKIYNDEKINSGEGVQGRYKQQLLKYYRKENDLHGKEEWITEKFIEGKMSCKNQL